MELGGVESWYSLVDDDEEEEDVGLLSVVDGVVK